MLPGRIMVLLVCLGAVLGALQIYEPFAEWAGAGANVPLLGFGNNLWKGVKEMVDEKGFAGIFLGGFKNCAAGLSAALVFSYIALYRIYKSANPNSATTMLVLSIFFPVIIPFVIFGLRKRDDGMPYGQQGPMGYAPYGAQPPYYGQGQYQPYQGYQNPAGGFAPQGYQPPMQQNPNAQYPGGAPYQGNPAQQPGAQPAQPQQNGVEQGEDPSQR